jgi:hypothetical protein
MYSILVIMSLWRACNLTSFSPQLTDPVDYPFASRHKGPGFKSPGGYLCETGILLLAMSRYIGDPDVINHCGLVWARPRLSRTSSRTVTRPSCRQCDNPTWSHTAFLSWFHAHCRSPFRLHNQRSRLRGGALWRACNLTSFSLCLTDPVDYPLAYRQKGSRFKSPGGYLCGTGILLLEMSRYKLTITLVLWSHHWWA